MASKRKGRRKGGYDEAVITRAPFPLKLKTRMRYVSTLSFDPGAGTVATWVIAANDLYDPDVTGGGHQPKGFDQFVGVMYDHYVVTASRIKLRTAATATAATDNVIWGVYLKDNTTPPTDPHDAQENANGVSNVLTALTGSRSYSELELGFDANKFFGVNVVGPAEFQGSSGASCTEGAYYHIWACALDDSSNPTAFYVNVQVDFEVTLIEPKALGMS